MIVDDPVVTAEYEAIADALRPHAGHGDRLEDLTWQQVVGIAAAAVAPTVAQLRADMAAAVAERDRVVVESADVIATAGEAARRLVSNSVDSVAERVAELEAAVEWWRAEYARGGQRTAALERLAVQAHARWGHEGGPSPLRDALDAVAVV